MAYFNRRRALDDQSELNDHQHARALAISQFTGGNPRLARLLYDTLNVENMLDITRVLDALTDELADYYKGRVEDLPGTSAGLFDTLIRGGEPESQSGLAERVGADQNRIADSFRYLISARLLSASKETSGKERPVAQHLQSLIAGFSQHCTDPGVFRDLADLIREVFGSDGEAPAQELEALAHFHASGRTEAPLEKMDPDMATTIRRIWNLDDPEDILQKHLLDRRRKGRSGR